MAIERLSVQNLALFLRSFTPLALLEFQQVDDLSLYSSHLLITYVWQNESETNTDLATSQIQKNLTLQHAEVITF